MKVKFDLRKSVSDNAAAHYEKAKKSKHKLAGAEKALKETLKKIENIKLKQEKAEASFKPLESRKKTDRKRWYENFHWFYSSEGFLVVGGKDSVSNEILIKKHLEPKDVVFHAQVQGAPFFVIKNTNGKKIPESAINETAVAAASYSKAWKLGFGACDVYYVNPEQVSKNAPSGEYVPKGGFMIYGKKNWREKTELKLAIGFIIKDGAVETIGGPLSAVKDKSDYVAVISPGNRKSKELAEKIKKAVQKKAGEEHGRLIKSLGLQNIQRYIPGGKGELVE